MIVVGKREYGRIFKGGLKRWVRIFEGGEEGFCRWVVKVGCGVEME